MPMMCPNRRAATAIMPTKTETPKVPAGPLGDKKAALHDAANLCGMSYKDYMDMRRKQK